MVNEEVGPARSSTRSLVVSVVIIASIVGDHGVFERGELGVKTLVNLPSKEGTS